MREINLSADNLVKALLGLDKTANVCLLDSCGVTYGNSHLLMAGFDPVEICRIEDLSADDSLALLDQKLNARGAACIFTISYDFGLKLENIKTRHSQAAGFPEPDIFLAFFNSLVVHDYSLGKTFLTGDESSFETLEAKLFSALKSAGPKQNVSAGASLVRSNFSRPDYLKTVGRAKDFIQRGDTYQINLTQQLRAQLPPALTPERIFSDLRSEHPAPFAAFIRRGEDTVISASPERFLRVETIDGKKIARTAPIKGTRPRGKTAAEDEALKAELQTSAKDRAENVMIVDLLRNDIGRVCKFGTVAVEELCALEEHPTLFHLVSTIRGELRDHVSFSDLLRAVFPCGSITGAPKIRTMQIIDELETAPRGLSMGAIGYVDFDERVDMSVAIRTMVLRGREAVFNVGGGIVIDSVPELEYEETLVKAKALMTAIKGKLSF